MNIYSLKNMAKVLLFCVAIGVPFYIILYKVI
nr:MAG TPA: hypothetical protein [Caudoviricetes sp.]DAX92840.1 MAG TPA: hypothetical protein [Caudoviricetes sp.]